MEGAREKLGGRRGGGGERRPREDDVAAKEERDKETDADNEKTKRGTATGVKRARDGRRTRKGKA